LVKKCVKIEFDENELKELKRIILKSKKYLKNFTKYLSISTKSSYCSYINEYKSKIEILSLAINGIFSDQEIFQKFKEIIKSEYNSLEKENSILKYMFKILNDVNSKLIFC